MWELGTKLHAVSARPYIKGRDVMTLWGIFLTAHGQSLIFYEKAGRMLRPLVGDECHKKTLYLLRSPDLWSGSFTVKQCTKANKIERPLR